MYDKLTGLLDQLGYVETDGVRRHPDRTAIFVGDFIDRGDGHVDVLATVRAMVDAGAAKAVMGNHEFNAIAYATEHPEKPGTHLREHSTANHGQHKAFLRDVVEPARTEWITWFRTLPLWLDLGGLRVVHACWHEDSMLTIKAAFGGTTFPADDDAFLEVLTKASTKGTELYEAVETVLKGPEMNLEAYDLPPFVMGGDKQRHAARVSWWHGEATTPAQLAVIPDSATQVDGSAYPELPERECTERDQGFAYGGETPVVYGHYWRSWAPEEYKAWTTMTACVDFSAGKDGPLVAYQWSGEATIDPVHFVKGP